MRNAEGAAGRVIVFLKAPRPGAVKTRLAAELDDEAAAAIYQVLVARTLDAVRKVETSFSVELRLTPDDAVEEIAAWIRPGWKVRPQGAGDLGQRMERAVREAVQDGGSPVIVIGTDTPDLDAADLRSAVDHLGTHDVVLGPCTDGGYWLVGLRAPSPELFAEIPWSTPQVLALTRSRAEAAGLKLALLRKLMDIDTLEDWRTWLRGQPLLPLEVPLRPARAETAAAAEGPSDGTATG